jgi:rod shape-determining protein MreD
MFLKYLKYFLITVFLILFQKSFISLISIESIIPDLTFLLIVFIAIREGQISAMLSGFIIGLFLDILSPNFIGLGALSYTIGGFVAGYFYDEYKTYDTLQSYFFIFIIFLSSVFTNIIYFIIFVQGSEMNFWFLLLKFGFGTTLYTMLIGSIFVFILSRRQLNAAKEVISDE